MTMAITGIMETTEVHKTLPNHLGTHTKALCSDYASYPDTAPPPPAPPAPVPEPTGYGTYGDYGAYKRAEGEGEA
jgi:hypothetical protein